MGASVSEPTPELGADAPDVAHCVREAMSSLSGPQYNAGVTFARSEHFWAAVEGAKRHLVARVQADAGGREHAAETLLGLVDGYAEARLLRTSLFLRLMDAGGPVTHKGKTRALYSAWCAALDREAKLAQIVGLTRRGKDVGGLTAYLAGQED